MSQVLTLDRSQVDASRPHVSRPRHLTAFSYDSQRGLLLNDQRNESIQFYREPITPNDLNQGFNDAVWRDDTVSEGLDALLDCLLAMEHLEDVLQNVSLITWRGMATRLITALYEDREAWSMNAQVIDGVLYLEDHVSPNKLAEKVTEKNNLQRKLQTYYGYSFESLCTTSNPKQEMDTPFQPVNTNVQWCSVSKGNIAGFRMIIGGEVDCVQAEADVNNLNCDDFIELKTNMVIATPRDEMRFERYKLLKIWAQSYLLGVARVLVGFRTRDGQLSSLHHFNTLEIPRLVRQKPHGWDACQALNAGHSIAQFIHATVSKAESTRRFNFLFDSRSIDDLEYWPVFRVDFFPGTTVREMTRQPRISIRELAPEEIGKHSEKKKIGIVTREWLQGVLNRRRQAQ